MNSYYSNKNKALIEKIANDKTNYKGSDDWENECYGKTLKNGKQIWAEVRNDEIRNAGINNVSKIYNPVAGFKNLANPK